MLQASNIATKDGLQNVIMKLLENLKRSAQLVDPQRSQPDIQVGVR